MSMDFGAFLLSLVLFPLVIFLFLIGILLGVSFVVWGWPPDLFQITFIIFRISCALGWVASVFFGIDLLKGRV